MPNIYVNLGPATRSDLNKAKETLKRKVKAVYGDHLDWENTFRSGDSVDCDFWGFFYYPNGTTKLVNEINMENGFNAKKVF